jgi:TolB protein
MVRSGRLLAVGGFVLVLAGCQAPGQNAPGDADAGADPTWQAYQGANGRIAFPTYLQTPQGGTIFKITFVNPDGTGRTQIPPDPDDVHDTGAAWSADGKHLAFASSRESTWPHTEIFTVNADGSCSTRLTNAAAASGEPDWSPDGRYIAFQRGCKIFKMNADGTREIKLTTGGCTTLEGQSFHPRWSPDGSKILFDSYRTGNLEMFTMNPDGTGVVNLTNHGASDYNGDWSPDGTRILFFSTRDTGFGDIYVIEIESGQVTRLTDSSSGTEHRDPVWSPNGQKIAFLRGDGLYRMNADGSNETLIATQVAGGGIDWGPRDTSAPVTWVNALGVAAICNNLTKSSASVGWGAGASAESLVADGSLEFTTGESDTAKVAGLSSGDDGWDRTDIDFGLYLKANGTVAVYEAGTVRKRVGVYAAGDAFRIAVSGGVVSYWRNGVRLYTSTTAPSPPLLVDTSLHTPGATVKNVTLDPGN